MVVTEEQKERIKKNRERALEIQRKRQREEEQKKSELGEANKGDKSSKSEGDTPTGGTKTDGDNNRKKLKGSPSSADGKGREDEEDIELEEFEIGASDFVTKKEAMKVYLLPEGTLAVCEFVEKPNPHNKGFAPMKLYHRSEVRRRSRERFGGLEGLVKERRRREEKRFQKDLQQTKNIFR